MEKLELSKTIRLDNGVLVPSGTPLEFDNRGKAMFQGHAVYRKAIPIGAILGGKSIFLNACHANVLNDNRGFQACIGKHYEPWCHVLIYKGYAIVYIWDTREVVDCIDLNKYAKDQDIVKTLKSSDGKVIKKFLGRHKAWLPTLIDMTTWDRYLVPDNAMPLQTKNKDWQKIIQTIK